MNPMRLSVNIGNPEDLAAIAKSYHPTKQAIEFVHRLASAALKGGEAHALQGPYGAGKSSLAAFTLNQVSCPTQSFAPHRTPELFENGRGSVSELLNAGGLAPIPIVGASESLASRVARALKTFARSMQNPPSVSTLRICAGLDPDKVTHEEMLRLLVETTQGVRQLGKAGALLVIDEFGRHLDHMLATGSDADFHLLQSIAELTGRTDSPLSLLIVQHYGLEHYSARFFGDRRAEWEKVRGRFRETILNNTEVDAAHIIGKALKSSGRYDGHKLRMPKPDDSGPKLLGDAEFLAAASKCRPLHPMTAAVLSRLARLLGQQDRTIVGWLTTDLGTGFDAARSNVSKGWIYPDSLFEHFFGDALLVPSNPALAMRFAAIHSAHERIGDEISAQARVLFQTLSMLSFGGGRGIASNKTCALACLPPRFPFEKCIGELTKSSLVVYRRYRGEYAIWEGSDYDVARRVDEEMTAVSLDVASEMNRRASRRVLAHGHLIRTGNRRSAQIHWLRAEDAAPPGDGKPRILVWISDQRPPEAHSGDVTGVAQVHALEPHLKESAAIRRLLEEDSALQDDLVAEKELRLRLDFHESRISVLTDDLLDSDLQWQTVGRAFPRLQEALSAAMDGAYPRALPLHNELVNRDKVSGQVSAALRKLIAHLHDHPDEENLGIDKFPAERIIYESLLKQSGLHVKARGKWQIRLEKQNLPEGFASIVGEIRKLYLETGQGAHPTIEDVAVRLGGPPFGVKRTPAKLLCILVVLADRDGHEIYEEHQFLPRWGPQTLLRMLKAPARFSVAAAAKSPVGKRFMRDYRMALTGTAGSGITDTPVAIVRELLVRHSRLSVYARQTTSVSDGAQAFRRALSVAKSPGDMLFRTIPGALGHSSLPPGAADRKEFLSGVRFVQAELDEADTALLGRLESVALDTIDCDDVKAARTRCMEFANCLVSGSQMFHGYGEFLAQILNDSTLDDRAWFAGVVDEGLGIAVPISSWSDAHAAQAEFLLRRNLLGIQRAADLISDLRLQQDGAPFAVFWPRPEDGERANDIKLLVDKISSIVGEVPRDSQMAVIVDLAREIRAQA